MAFKGTWTRFKENKGGKTTEREHETRSILALFQFKINRWATSGFFPM